MLYWTEDDLLCPRMLQVAKELARECGDDAYEAKIGSLVRNLHSHLTAEERELWNHAVLRLCDGDHYLALLIDAGAPPKPLLIPIPKGLQGWLPEFNHDGSRPSGDRLRLVLVALIILGLIFVTMLLFGRR